MSERINRNLSFSQIKSWLECRRQWGYKFRDGFRPNSPKLEFTRGTLIHLGMQWRVTEDLVGRPLGYPDEDWWTRTLREWHMEWDPVMGDDMVVEPGWFEGCRFIVEAAAEVFHQGWEVIEDERGPMLERRLYVNLPDWYKGLVYIPDVVARRRTGPLAGGIFTVDFKTFGKAKERDYGDFDLQGAIYQRGIVGTGIDAIGSCLFQIVQEPPKAPRVNKDGSIHAGDAKAQQTWKPVRDELETFRSPEFLEGIWQHVVLQAAEEIYQAEVSRHALSLKYDYYACKFCEFRAPCLARLKGEDADDILATQFTQRKR